MPLRSKARGYLALATTALVAIAVWGVILPRLARLPAVVAWTLRNNALGIDPSAKFYTEHEAYPAYVQRVRQVRQAHANEFWSPAPRVEVGRP
jgi:hypothetical protein